MGKTTIKDPPTSGTEQCCCPICLREFDGVDLPEIYAASCSHSCCMICWERLLVKPSSKFLLHGKCPICRASVSLFELKKKKKGVYPLLEYIFPYEEDWWKCLPTVHTTGEVTYKFSLTNYKVCFVLRAARQGQFDIYNSIQDGVISPHGLDRAQYHRVTQSLCITSVDNGSVMILTFSDDFRFVTRAYSYNPGNREQTIRSILSPRATLRSETPLNTPSITTMHTRQPHPHYSSKLLWGNTFCQAFAVGVASYHFISPTSSYISYESPLTRQWPLLDNGRPIPTRIYFRNVSLQQEVLVAHERRLGTIFSGQICWQDDMGSTWQGSLRWDYEMHFDSRFQCIVSGTVHTVTTESRTPNPMSVYGTELIYTNAALFRHWKQQRDGGDRGISVDKQRLVWNMEKVPVRNQAHMCLVLEAVLSLPPNAQITLQTNPDPFDYNLL